MAATADPVSDRIARELPAWMTLRYQREGLHPFGPGGRARCSRYPGRAGFMTGEGVQKEPIMGFLAGGVWHSPP